MSKFSDYLRACAEHYERVRLPQHITVEEFAHDLNLSVTTIVEQFKSAGITKDPNDFVSEEDKERLLAYLRESHGVSNRPPITLTRRDERVRETEPQRQLRAVAEGRNGAEWQTLEHFTGVVLWGLEVDPQLQRLVNLIVARSFIVGKLPKKQLGRPIDENTDRLGEEIARAYWDMRDSGQAYSATVEVLCSRFHKDERHLMRLAKKHKSSIGATLESRNRKREWESALHYLFRQLPPGGDRLSPIHKILRANQLPPELAKPEISDNDLLAHLDEVIQQEAKKLSPDTKDGTFKASD